MRRVRLLIACGALAASMMPLVTNAATAEQNAANDAARAELKEQKAAANAANDAAIKKAKAAKYEAQISDQNAIGNNRYAKFLKDSSFQAARMAYLKALRSGASANELAILRNKLNKARLEAINAAAIAAEKGR